MKYYVYALVDPFYKLPFYIGKGCGDRAFKHLRGYESVNERKNQVIRAIRSLGEEPFVVFLEHTDNEKEAYNLEWQYIKAFKTHLTNRVSCTLHPPSRKGATMPESAKKKLSEFWTGKKRGPFSDEHRAKMSAALKGRPRPPRSTNKQSNKYTEISGVINAS